MSRINQYDYRKAREEVNIISLLNDYGYNRNAEGKYICPFHTEKTPSASVKNNRMKCFGCGKVATTIDLVMELEQVDQFTAIRKLLDKDVIFRASKEKEPIDMTQSIKYDYEYGLKISRPSDKTNIGYIKGYLNKRGLLLMYDKLKLLGVELRHNYYKGENYICYNFKDYEFIIQKSISGNSKKNFGSPVPVYFSINNTNDWYIVEGIEDAFTLMLYHKFNVVCLNSVSNTDKFLSDIKQRFKPEEVKFIIATDNDESGINTLDKLNGFFKDNDIEYDLYYSFYEYSSQNNLKDLNECLIHSLKEKLNRR